MWGRQVYRWSDLDFEANIRQGIAIDWPIRYADIAPWYDYVEDFIGISGEALGLPQLPDSRFLPPMELNPAEIVIKDAIAKNFGKERVLTIGRVAILTKPHRGRAACHYCGPCERGCITRSYFSSVNATLPAAEKTGRMTLRPYSVVHSVIFDARTRKATGVRVIDAKTRTTTEFRAQANFSVRFGARICPHPFQLGHSRIFQWSGELQRGTRPQPDGSRERRRRSRESSPAMKTSR